MVDTIDKRLGDLEAIVTDLPELLNLRLERIDVALRDNAARFDEMSGRMNLLDKQMGMLIRDLRDMRGGVTRQLVEQDKRLATMEQRLDALEQRFGAIEQRFSALEQRFGAMETDVSTLKADSTEIKSDVKAILAHLSRS